MPEPTVSVIIATRNQADFLPAALNSVKEQGLPAAAVQVITVNDGSTDSTGEILRRNAGWIERIERRESLGLPASCNEGLSRARGRYFARLDSDDLADPAWLETLVQALEADASAVCAIPDRWEGNGAAWRPIEVRPENLYSLIACGTLFRTEPLRAAGGFRPLYWEEYDLYLRLRPKGKFLHVKKPLYRYRKHSGGMTSDEERRRLGWKELAQVWGVEALRSAGLSPELEQAVR